MNVKMMNVNAENFRQVFASHNAPYLLKGILIGVVIGFVVGVFRLILDKTLQGLFVLYPYMKANPETILYYSVATVVVWLLLVKVVKPLQQEGNISWWSSLWRTFVGALLAICPGIFAGREGPCIKMGSFIAQGFSEKVFKDSKEDKDIFIHGGMSAGLAAAFSAPIAGTLFLIEAVGLVVSPLVLFTSLTASIASVIVTYFFFGITPCLYVPYVESIPLNYYWTLLIFGILIGIFCRVFQFMLNHASDFYAKLPIPKDWNSIVPLVLVIPIGLAFPRILGGSHDLIAEVSQNSFIEALIHTPGSTLIGWLILVAVIRLIFTVISCGATAPTGVFMPILVLGALCGSIYAVYLTKFALIPESYYVNFVICGMAAFFAASLKTPFTAVILLVEAVGSVKYVMPILIVTWIATITNEWLNGKSVYK